MSNSTVQYIKTHTTASVQPNQVLRGGSSVFVRVLSDNGNGRYTVSFAGNSVDVQSAAKSTRQLVAGQTFLATVQTDDDGKILLVPKNESYGVDAASIERVTVVENGVNSDGTPNAALSSFLVAQGLCPDASTVKILQFLQQTGVKTDTSLMMKAQKIALRFAGREKQAAEAAILLLEKGIDPDDALIGQILDALTDDGGEAGASNSQANKRELGGFAHDNESKADSGDPKQTDDFSAEPDFLLQLYDEIPDRKPGVLTLLNQLSSERKHWIFLPYEWNGDQNDHLPSAKGIIRILVDTQTQKVEKIAINCRTKMTNYYFVLYYIESKVKEVRFCALPPLLSLNKRSEELRLGELLRSGMNLSSPVTVTYSTSACCDGICTDETPPLFFTPLEQGVRT